MTRLFWEILGDLLYGIGWIVGWIKYRFGLIRPIPKRYRSSRWDDDGESRP